MERSYILHFADNEFLFCFGSPFSAPTKPNAKRLYSTIKNSNSQNLFEKRNDKVSYGGVRESGLYNAFKVDTKRARSDPRWEEERIIPISANNGPFLNSCLCTLRPNDYKTIHR